MPTHRGLSAVLRHLVNVTLHAACFSDAPGPSWVAANHMRDEIAEHLVLQLAISSPLSHTPSQRIRSQAVGRALEVIEFGLGDGLSIRDVARRSGMGRRTLEYAFRDRLGVSPKAFVNTQRMILTRRDLRARSGDVPIADIANRWGFWHMGQFAKDYARQFGELPSQTCR